MQFGAPCAEQMHNNPLQYTEVYVNTDASYKWGGEEKKRKEKKRKEKEKKEKERKEKENNNKPKL